MRTETVQFCSYKHDDLEKSLISKVSNSVTCSISDLLLYIGLKRSQHARYNGVSAAYLSHIFRKPAFGDVPAAKIQTCEASSSFEILDIAIVHYKK